MKPRLPAAARDPQSRPGRYFRLTYTNTTNPDDEPKLFQGRDGVAFNELSAALPALGYEYGTTIQFYPDDERTLSEFPVFQANDLLVLTTRPPLTDRESLFPPRRIIRNSRNDLEKLIFKQMFTHFAHCTRKHVKLTPEAKKSLKGDADKWEFLEFFEHAGENHPFGQAHIQKHMSTGRKPERFEIPSTVVFLVRTSSLPGVGSTPSVPCGLLACFGMDGYSTLIWNRIIRLQHPDWLLRPGFIMAELLFKQPIPRRPLTPEFATDPAYIELNLLTNI